MIIINLKRVAGVDSEIPKMIAENVRGIIVGIKKDFCFAKTFYGDIFISLSRRTTREFQMGDTVKFNILEKSDGSRNASRVKLVHRPEILSSEQKLFLAEQIKVAKNLPVQQKLPFLIQLREVFPFDLASVTMVANCYFEDFEKNQDEIRIILRKGLDVNPFDSYLLSLSGKYFYLVKNYSKAKEQFENVLRLRPEDAVAMTELAKVESALLLHRD